MKSIKYSESWKIGQNKIIIPEERLKGVRFIFLRSLCVCLTFLVFVNKIIIDDSKKTTKKLQ